MVWSYDAWLGKLLRPRSLAGKYVFDPYIFNGGDTGIPFMGGSDNSSALNEFSKIVEKYGTKYIKMDAY